LSYERICREVSVVVRPDMRHGHTCGHVVAALGAIPVPGQHFSRPTRLIGRDFGTGAALFAPNS
jgi:hypothetical protein